MPALADTRGSGLIGPPPRRSGRDRPFGDCTHTHHAERGDHPTRARGVAAPERLARHLDLTVGGQRRVDVRPGKAVRLRLERVGLVDVDGGLGDLEEPLRVVGFHAGPRGGPDHAVTAAVVANALLRRPSEPATTGQMT
jgi:hypothetical protein